MTLKKSFPTKGGGNVGAHLEGFLLPRVEVATGAFRLRLDFFDRGVERPGKLFGGLPRKQNIGVKNYWVCRSLKGQHD